MRDPVSSQYSSFLFLRMPIPELDLSELEGLGLSDTPTYKIKGSSASKMTGQATGAEQKNAEGDILLEYSTFNFWRAPIAHIHAFELDLLLRPRLVSCHLVLVVFPFQLFSSIPLPF
ncbi:Protein AF1q [Heterocephalus glaber]|uniref:Protein AF1q n=1 Tax=Heterocephalus glaber TaxID=10181 RepID=G5BCP7_HETGA|nr:protein AF1q [Heterocephalus glaber]EHB07058.1 Protein AF1q [Heterocephalus glaber]